MGSEPVISIHSPMHHRHGSTVTAEGTVQVQLCFQNPIDSFCHGIIIRASALRHTDVNVLMLQHLHIRITTVLHSSIRVMDELSLLLSALQGSNSFIQSKEAALCF